MQLWDISRRRQCYYMLFGYNVCVMGIIRAKDNAIYAFRDNSSLSIGIIRVYRDISSSISSH